MLFVLEVSQTIDASLSPIFWTSGQAQSWADCTAAT